MLVIAFNTLVREKPRDLVALRISRRLERLR